MMKSNTYFLVVTNADHFLWLQSLSSEFIIACNIDCPVTSLTSRVPKHSHLQFSNLTSELQILIVAVNCNIIQLTDISLICRHSAVQVFISV